MVSGRQGSPLVVKVTDDHVTEFIRSYWNKCKYGPSVRDIADEFDVSTSTVHRHLMNLVEEGALTVNQGRARTWRLSI
jgi:DNA-binding GntR family transcriptional regulator